MALKLPLTIEIINNFTYRKKKKEYSMSYLPASSPTKSTVRSLGAVYAECIKHFQYTSRILTTQYQKKKVDDYELQSFALYLL